MPRQTEDSLPERFVPDEMRRQLAEAEHVARYTWAAGFCPGRRVLDAGCGSSRGSQLLADAGASEVIGVDVSEAVLELAVVEGAGGVSYEAGDLRSLAYADDSFDLVVCFGVIDWVDDAGRVLDELARVLRPEGLLLMSCGNRDRAVPGNSGSGRAFRRSELQAALDARFGCARLISQHVMLASVIGWSPQPRLDVAWAEAGSEPTPDDELHLLAIAGSAVTCEPDPVVTLTSWAEARRWLEHDQLLERRLEEQARRLEDLAGRDADRRVALERLADAEQELAGAKSALAELAAVRRELDTTREALTVTRAELAPLRAVMASRSYRLTAPLRRIATEVRRRRG
jgi:SAM-dependent methyltransferase